MNPLSVSLFLALAVASVSAGFLSSPNVNYDVDCTFGENLKGYHKGNIYLDIK